MSASIFCVAQTGPGGVGTAATTVFWLDANSGLTLFGPNVTGWTDRTGNNSNAAPPTANARPTLVSNNVNTFPSIDFDGIDDELRITDKVMLDLTSWHFFAVVSVDFQKDYNAWLTKGNDGSENFELLSYGTGGNIGNIHAPILFTTGVRTFPSTGAGMVTTGNAFNIIEYSYSSAVGRDVYKNFGNQLTDNENRTPQTNNFDIYIGNEKTTARFLNGDIAELIGYNAIQTAAGRTIVNNYLSSKYNIALTASDFYAGDTGPNGNYDFDVAGIGQTAGVSINAFDPSVSAGMGITYVSGFQNGDFILTGHNLKTGNDVISTDVLGMAGLNNGRWLRTWYVDVTNAGAAMVSNVKFDLSDGGVLGGVAPAIAANYVLLSRAGTAGIWTLSPIVPTLAGDVITFSGVTLTDGYYTIGTLNSLLSPLPIELVYFNGKICEKAVCLEWETASELNNNYFTLERSFNGLTFHDLNKVPSKAVNGTSTSTLDYSGIDNAPVNGTNYYRLKQTDINETSTYSKIVAVTTFHETGVRFTIYPNPNSGEFFIDFYGLENHHDVEVNLTSMDGKLVYSNVFSVSEDNAKQLKIIPDGPIPNGTYICTLTMEGIKYPVKVIVS